MDWALARCMSQKMGITLVLPIKLDRKQLRDDLYRLFEVQLLSLITHFEMEAVQDFILIAKTEDINQIRAAAERFKHKVPLKYIEENKLCRYCSRTEAWWGWHKQQILKIAVSRIVSTKYYITLDNDVFLTRRMSGEDILYKGRILFTKNRREKFEDYWRSSCEILRVPMETIPRGSLGMEATPEVMVTELVIQLQDEISTLHGTSDWARWLLQAAGADILRFKRPMINWIIHKATGHRTLYPPMASNLVERFKNWTEYQLYWTFLAKHGLAEQYYAVDGPDLTGGSVWSNAEAEGRDLGAWVSSVLEAPHEYFFSVFQSTITNVERMVLYENISRLLKANGPVV